MRSSAHSARCVARRQRGFALILVLWLGALFVVVGITYGRAVHSAAIDTQRIVASARARALAAGGVWWAAQHLLAARPGEIRSGRLGTLMIDGDPVEVTLDDEARKIDLNAAPPELLEGLLRGAGLGTADAAILAGRIVDWRDADGRTREGLPEPRTAGQVAPWKDAPFNTVSELERVPGMSRTLFRALQPSLTVYSARPTVTLAAASERTLRAIPYYDATQLDESGRPILPPGAAQHVAATGGPAFTVRSSATVRQQAVTIHAVLYVAPDSADPVSVLAWQEGVATRRGRR